MRVQGLWHRMAGLSGASSIILATYGSHGLHPADQHYIQVFQTASQYHLAHSLLLALAPLTKRPHITGSLTAVGIGLFSGRWVWCGLTCASAAQAGCVWLRDFTMQPLHHSSKGRPQLLSAGPSRVGLLVFAAICSLHCKEQRTKQLLCLTAGASA